MRLTGVETASKYPKKIRRIGIYNVQGGYTIDVYTNDFKHAASTIAALYRSRWKIEIFFRSLKQNLHIKSFLGTSQNAVEIQIWTALITILLLQYLKRIAETPLVSLQFNSLFKTQHVHQNRLLSVDKWAVFTANVKGRLTRLTAILHPSPAKNV